MVAASRRRPETCWSRALLRVLRWRGNEPQGLAGIDDNRPGTNLSALTGRGEFATVNRTSDAFGQGGRTRGARDWDRLA